MPTAKTAAYGEASIRVLKGLEPVKQRPGMYTRTDNPLHIVQEVIDNAADEALAGFGQRIGVILHADGSVTVDDDGRGIPFGLHPEEQVPVLEIVYTRLHAGGKFDKGAGGAYSFSGGLHGVGVSVTNALSRRLQVASFREGQVATLAFAGGDVCEKLALRKAAAGDRKHGTSVRTWPDAKYFESPELPRAELVHLLRSKAVLMPGVTVSLTVEKAGQKEPEHHEWKYAAGLRDYLKKNEPQFLTQFTRKLLGYALGRQTLPSDKKLLQQMQTSLKANGGHFSAAVLEIVKSRQFLNRRAEPQVAALPPPTPKAK